jgi:phospholipase/carboxylesterase
MAGIALALAPLSPALATPPPMLGARPTQVATTLPAGVTRLTNYAYVYRPKLLMERAPLIVLLHGAGGQASLVLDRYIPVADRRKAIVLALQSSDVTWRIQPSRDGGADFGPGPEHLDAALTALFARVSVDPGRIVLIGFSDGASYGLSIGLANPQLFRSIIALSPGYLLIPTRVDPSQRVFIAHGRRDEILPFSNVTGQIMPDLQRAGVRPRVHWFNGGHTVDQAVVNEALDFALGPLAVSP